MAFITRSQVEDYLNIDIPTALDARLDTWIASAEKWIENYTDRTFEAETFVKKFDGSNKRFLYVDDLLSVSNVWFVANQATADGATRKLSTVDWLTYQEDNANKTPYNKLVLNPDGNHDYFPKGFQNVWIDGSWGYSETAPADVQQACIKLVAGIVKTSKEEGSDIKQFSEGDFSITYGGFDKIAERDISLKEVLLWYKRKDPLNSYRMYRA